MKWRTVLDNMKLPQQKSLIIASNQTIIINDLLAQNQDAYDLAISVSAGSTFAMAETGWTPDNGKNFENFVSRLEGLHKRYDAIGISYFKGEYRDTKAAKERK